MRAVILMSAAALCCARIAAAANAPAQDPVELLRRQLVEQSAKLEELQRQVGDQQKVIANLLQAVDDARLDRERGTGAASTQTTQPVGEAPKQETRAPEVAQIFSEPTVLTRGGDVVF